MATELPIDPSCSVCGRRLLPGERPTAYITRDGAEATVCELCKPRAEAAGWLLPDEADARRAAGTGRERRRPRGQMLGGLLARFPASGGEERAPVDEAAAVARSRRRPPRPPGAVEEEAPAHSAERIPEAPPAGAGAAAAATHVPEALMAFNASNHRRTVAGLSRTLGPPRATGLEVRTKGGDDGVRLTVAWELTWYQWEVGPGQRGPEVRESGKGETIDQLRSADRTWNLMVDSDGTLEQRAAGAASGDAS